MTKVFKEDSIIELPDGGYVVVDKEAAIIEGDRFIINEYNASQYGIKTAEVIGYDIIRAKEGFPQVFPFDKSKCVKIIASINKRIEEVPLIELPDEASSLCPYRNIVGYETWMEGYKAAQKTYSEEDMRKAFNAGSDYGYSEYARNNLGNMKFPLEKDEDDYLKSLQTKKIIAVELEYFKDFGNDVDGKPFDAGIFDWTLKVSEGNIIHPVNVVFSEK